MVIVLLIVALLTYFGPSADVTLTLPSRSLSLPMQLTATATSRQDVIHHTVPAQTLVFDTTVSGPGPATGKTTVGTKAATGIVTFTNTGSSQIDIPTGTVVATRDGIQFVTTADALALTAPNNTIPAPIQAQTSGASGNVPAGSITSIPPSSQSAILEANPGLAQVTLTLTNADPTTGGGAGSATSVSSSDVKAEQAVLNTQVQARIKTFLSQHVQAGDELGQPIQTETPMTTPAVGQVTSNGSFIETLKAHMTVLVVRAADLQAAATAQFKATLSKQNQGVALVPQQSVAFKQVKKQPSKNGTALLLSFTAVGQVAPQISEETVRGLVSGKTAADARSVLASTKGLPTVLSTQITIYPGFFHWLPFWQQHIHVYFKTMEASPAPKPKPKHH